MDKIISQDGSIVTMQQAICIIPSSDGNPLFTGVECMGDTDTVVFTYHKKRHDEAVTTVNKFWRAIQGILLATSFEELGMSPSTAHSPELEAIQKQKSDYLDGFLNLEHCSNLDINRKHKKYDDTVGGHTALSGLTNVSPQSHNSATTTWSAVTAKTNE